ncbi:proteolipid protein 2-like [Engraulis encrasicolus]|uniref:proteolipid protein 2-like n=1 Tax=Engraulis encrasicolus TaxID=184585 RepID=UPI002FD65F3A
MDHPEIPVAQGTRYLMTRKGMVMAGEIVICLIVLICKVATSGCYIGVPICEMVLAIFFLVLFATGMDRNFGGVHWLWSDFFRSLTACPVVLSSVIVCLMNVLSAAVLAEILIIPAGFLFGFDAWIVFTTIKNRRNPGQNGGEIIA